MMDECENQTQRSHRHVVCTDSVHASIMLSRTKKSGSKSINSHQSSARTQLILFVVNVFLCLLFSFLLNNKRGQNIEGILMSQKNGLSNTKYRGVSQSLERTKIIRI